LTGEVQSILVWEKDREEQRRAFLSSGSIGKRAERKEG
jgi:hypothetical protein